MAASADAQLTGTDALDDLGCGTLGTNEVLFSDCTWATIPDQTPGADSIGVDRAEYCYWDYVLKAETDFTLSSAASLSILADTCWRHGDRR